jgi:hypothetical protein
MATKSRSNFSTLSQTQPGALTEFVRHFSANGCPTATDVRMQAAQVRTFRAKAYNAQPPAPTPTPETPVIPVLVKQLPPDSSAPAPTPAAPALVLAEQAPAVRGRISVRRVLEVTAKHFRTTPDDLVAHCRKRPLVRQRQIAMYVAYQVTGHGLPFIGSKIGGRDHTTILHGVRVVEALIDAGDAETATAVDRIIERLQVTGGAHD